MTEDDECAAAQDGVSLAELLDRPNPWSDWLNEEDFPPLAQLRFAALLLRELPVATLVDRLAPALIAADQESQEVLAEDLASQPVAGDVVFGFEDWLVSWDDRNGEPYTAAVRDVLRQVATTADLRRFAEIAQHRSLDATTLLWFLLGGIRRWVHGDGERDDLADDARWLFDLLGGECVSRDPLGTLFSFLYERHRRGRGQGWLPIDGDLALEQDGALFLDLSQPLIVSEDLILGHAASAAHKPALRLSDLLSFDPRAWPQAATGIADLRRRGLLSTKGYQATPRGRGRAGRSPGGKGSTGR